MTRDTDADRDGDAGDGLHLARRRPEVFDQVVEYFHDSCGSQISLDWLHLKDIKFEPEKSLESLPTCAS